MRIMDKYYCIKTLAIRNDIRYEKGIEYLGCDNHGLTFVFFKDLIGLNFYTELKGDYKFKFSDHFLTKQQYRKRKIENILKEKP